MLKYLEAIPHSLPHRPHLQNILHCADKGNRAENQADPQLHKFHFQKEEKTPAHPANGVKSINFLRGEVSDLT